VAELGFELKHSELGSAFFTTVKKDRLVTDHERCSVWWRLGWERNGQKCAA
jgi:hypothetical protein